MSRHLLPSVLVTIALAGVAAAVPGSAAVLETQAREAFLIDMSTGSVLLEKDADRPMPPASMSKIMTMYMVFERLKEGRLSLDDELLVSEKAWRKGGSKMFVEVGNKVRVEDLIRGVIVQSGNDASIVLAEGLGGSEEAFADEMTRKAHQIGMTDSTFRNATGWPDPEHRTTARDLATLAMRTIRDFPDLYHYYGETEFVWNRIRQSNRNPLLYNTSGADGLKTGHTEEAGYGLTASVKRGDRRIVLVVNGLPSIKARSEEGARLAEWAFREFDSYQLFEAGEVVDQAILWLGEEDTVPLVLGEDFRVTMTRKGRNSMKVAVKYEGPIATPVEAGQRLATLVVTSDDGSPMEVPLLAGKSVDQLGPLGRIVGMVKSLVLGTP